MGKCFFKVERGRQQEDKGFMKRRDKEQSFNGRNNDKHLQMPTIKRYKTLK